MWNPRDSNKNNSVSVVIHAKYDWYDWCGAETSGDCAVLWPETVSGCQSGSRQQYLAWAGPRPGTRTGAGPGVGQQGAVYRYRYYRYTAQC